MADGAARGTAVQRGARFARGDRVLVQFEDGVDYPGTVHKVTGDPPLYVVHFDDGDE